MRFGEKVVKTSRVTAIKESPGFNYTDPALLYLPLPNSAAQWKERERETVRGQGQTDSNLIEHLTPSGP